MLDARREEPVPGSMSGWSRIQAKLEGCPESVSAAKGVYVAPADLSGQPPGYGEGCLSAASTISQSLVHSFRSGSGMLCRALGFAHAK